jgi:V/A-type H+-transporting ATPase subunit D
MGFAYNKSTIQLFHRQLRMREKALPVLMGKEAALRKAVKEFEQKRDEAFESQKRLMQKLEEHDALWMEMPALLQVEHIERGIINVAGIQLESIQDVHFRMLGMAYLPMQIWLQAGIEQLKVLVRSTIELDFLNEQCIQLQQARRKTTQKVNLYEKVQIPYYEESIRKIKRFLEDKENIATAAKKIAKARREQAR